jgi:protein-S-isoprenylcysteine O-methyltransferase Ste14
MMSSILQWLARRRVTFGFLSAMVAMWLAEPTARWVAVGGVVALVGEAMRVWAAGHLDKGREVTTTGPYRVTRHPLYLGSAIIGVGVAIASANAIVAALVLGYLVVTLTAAILTEESHLTQKFGAAYPEYREGRSAGAGRRFSVERVMRNREYRAVAGLTLAFALLWWKAMS